MSGTSTPPRPWPMPGFVVAALSHNGDSWRDPSNPTAIWERPRQLKLLTDYMLGAWRDRGRIDANRVGAFGFSAGGLTMPWGQIGRSVQIWTL